MMWAQTRIKLFSLFLFLILCQFSWGRSQGDNVLILNSYTENYIGNSYIYDGIADHFLKSGEKVKLTMESLMVYLLNTPEDVTARKQPVLNKYKDAPPKVIVLVGNSAFIIFREELETCWKDIPVLFCSDNDYVGNIESILSKKELGFSKEQSLEEATKGLNLTVVRCPVYVEPTIRMMRQVLPKMKKLALISDCRYISAQVRYEVEQVVKRHFPDLKISFLTNKPFTLDELADSLQSYDQTTGVLYYSWVEEQTQQGSRYMQANNYKMIVSITSDPIFTLMDVGIDTGNMAGGYFYRGKDMGKTVGIRLSKLLEGEKPLDIPWVNAGEPSAILCYNVLQAAGIDASLYPLDATYFFKPLTFWERHHTRILIIGILALAVFVFLVIYVWRETKHRKKEMLILKKYKNLFDSMPIAYFKHRLLKDEQGHYTDYIMEEANALYANSVTGKLYPIGSRGSMLDMDVTDYLEMYREVLRCQKPYSFEYHHETNNRFYELKVVPAVEPDAVDIYVVNITKLRKTQELVESINHKLAMALDVANIIPWKWDLGKRTILCDVKRPIEIRRNGIEGDEDTFSVPEAEYFAKIHKEDRKRVEQAYAKLISGKVEKIKEEYRVLHSADNHREFEWVEAQAAVDTRANDGKPLSLVGSSVVITQRKKMELELITAKDRAEESNRLKSAFLANMSHEIRTPLNAIVGFSNIISSTEKIEEREEYATIIENNNTLLLQLINDILDISKIEAGTLEFIYTDFNLNEMMRELERILCMRVEGKPIEVSCEMALPFCHIHSEKNRLMQVLINMLTNAAKFTVQGKICLGYRKQEDGMLYFYVTDTGCGIPKEQKETVFGRFVKLNNFQQGTGLGLSICETIVRKMRGRIGVDSEEGKGSTFWFTIPYVPVSVSLVQRVTTPSPSQMQVVERDKLKILIAEDTPSNYRLFETILKGEYELVHATNGREAVDLYAQHQPHLILMDINMPVLNGYEAVSEIRKLSATVPIIAVTAYAFEQDEQRILHSGFSAYTSKPINAAALKGKITTLLEKRLILI